MRYILYHILIGCGYNFLAFCMSDIVLHTGLPNLFMYCILRHVSNDVGLQCFVLILMHYLLHHHGDIRSDASVVCLLVHNDIGCKIFDDVAANKQCRGRRHIITLTIFNKKWRADFDRPSSHLLWSTSTLMCL